MQHSTILIENDTYYVGSISSTLFLPIAAEAARGVVHVVNVLKCITTQTYLEMGSPCTRC